MNQTTPCVTSLNQTMSALQHTGVCASSIMPLCFTGCTMAYLPKPTCSLPPSLQLLKGVTTTKWRTGTTSLPSTTAMYRCGTGAIIVQHIGGTGAVRVEYSCSEGAVQVQCRGGSGTLIMPVKVRHRCSKHPVWEAAGASMHIAIARHRGSTFQAAGPCFQTLSSSPSWSLVPNSSPSCILTPPLPPLALLAGDLHASRCLRVPVAQHLHSQRRFHA